MNSAYQIIALPAGVTIGGAAVQSDGQPAAKAEQAIKSGIFAHVQGLTGDVSGVTMSVKKTTEELTVPATEGDEQEETEEAVIYRNTYTLTGGGYTVTIGPDGMVTAAEQETGGGGAAAPVKIYSKDGRTGASVSAGQLLSTIPITELNSPEALVRGRLYRADVTVNYSPYTIYFASLNNGQLKTGVTVLDANFSGVAGTGLYMTISLMYSTRGGMMSLRIYFDNRNGTDAVAIKGADGQDGYPVHLDIYDCGPLETT